MNESFSCREIAFGRTEGEVLISADPILFYHADPETGIIVEQGHSLEGKSVKGKIIVFPGGKGSSVVQMDGLYKLEKHGTAPIGFIIREPDTVLVATAIIMEIPMADEVEPAFYERIKDGDRVLLDTEKGTLKILR